MAQGQRFALGLALMSTALSILFKKETWAWVGFFVGLVLVVEPIFTTLVFGRTRPSRSQIEAASAEEYKAWLINRKTKRWINWLDWLKQRGI